MSNTKEKAKELVDKFSRIDGYQDSIDLSKCEYEKQCALIAVDEILQALMFPPQLNEYRQVVHIKVLLYYKEVKQEINNL